MNDDDIVEKKLQKITTARELATAIEVLERKRDVMENNLKRTAHYFFENLNLISVLKQTLQSANKSPSSKFAIIKEALAFGAGYLSGRRLIGRLKNGLLDTFRFRLSGNTGTEKLLTYNPKESVTDEIITQHKILKMDPKIESVTAKPEVLPEPTYWPFFLALGIVFLGWGLLTTWLISLAGFIVLVIALAGWINILRHE